ncbi:MAG: hypothetical protein V1765_03330 [bacterium]
MPEDKLTKTEKDESAIDQEAVWRLVNIYSYKFFNIIILILVLVIFVCFYFFLLEPKYSAILSNDELNKKRQEFTDQSYYLIELRQLKAVYNNIESVDRDKINAIVNNTNEKEDLFQEMQYLAVRENLTLDSLDVMPLDRSYKLENLAGNIKRSPLFESVQVVKTAVVLSNVSYEGLIRAVKTIELNLRIMDINRVEYDPLNRKATIEFLTYQLVN